MSEIQEIVHSLEKGETDVDNILEKVKRASELIKFCKSKLYHTENELNNLLDVFGKE